MFGDKNKEKKEHLDPLAESADSLNQENADFTDTAKGEITISEQEFQNLKNEAAQNREKYVRIMAEFDNARKRMDRDKMDFVKYANEGLMSEFVEILDDLERSVAVAKEKHQDYSAFLKGIEMVMGRIYDMLKKNKVKPIEVLGKDFDPNLHEALMQEPTTEKKEGTITEEYQRGYMFDDRVLRTAKVKVAKNPDAGGAQDEEANQKES